MSDVITQKCAVCGALKPLPPDAAVSKWTRVFGVATGGSQNPITVISPQTRMRMMPGLNSMALDFCPGCAPKMTVDKLAGLYAVKKGA